MSRIDDLIAELCPDGVPYIRVEEAFDVLATPRGVKRSDYSLGTTIPIVDQGQSLVAGYTDDESRKIAEGQYVVFGDHTRSVKWVNFAFAVGADGTKVLSAAPGVLPKYAYYAMANLEITDRGYNRHWTIVRDLRIPVPPLEVQREIVRVLDQFTQLEAELEAELEARRRQYEHYLHAAILPDGDLEWTTLGDATTNHDRKRKPVTRSDRKEGEFPYYGANGIQDYVHDFIFDGTFLLIGEDGSVKNVDGTPVLNWASGKIWVNNHAHVLTASSEQFSLRYLYYYLATVDVTTYVTGGTQPKINQKNLNSIPVPVIARDFQDRVVEMLDRFDALVNDLSVGLPAELAARRKQYEYYRDRLLTFEEAAA